MNPEISMGIICQQHSIITWCLSRSRRHQKVTWKSNPDAHFCLLAFIYGFMGCSLWWVTEEEKTQALFTDHPTSSAGTTHKGTAEARQQPSGTSHLHMVKGNLPSRQDLDVHFAWKEKWPDMQYFNDWWAVANGLAGWSRTRKIRILVTSKFGCQRYLSKRYTDRTLWMRRKRWRYLCSMWMLTKG